MDKKMKITKKDPILGLKNVISRLFEIKFDNFDFDKYHPNLPQSLKELYEIDAFFAKHDCGFETIRFFCNQDRLLPYSDLKLEEKDFVFIRENQNNWICKTQLGSNKVYFEDRVFIENSRFLTTKIKAFLTTFALQEIGFNLPHYIGLHCEKVVEILPFFKKVEPLWSDKNYLNFGHFEYYLVDDDCLLMQAGMNILATKNQDKLNYYKGILNHYTF
jgi:hypothetical protein